MNNPIRTCIVCRNKFSQRDLIKITISKENEFAINKSGASGRSNYVCNDSNCLRQCINKKILNKRTKKQVPEEIYLELEKYIQE